MNVKPGDTVIYNDGRDGHQSVKALVMSVNETSMIVQFEDRADATFIRFSDKAWMDHITVA